MKKENKKTKNKTAKKNKDNSGLKKLGITLGIIFVLGLLFFIGYTYKTLSKPEFDVNEVSFYSYNNYDFYREGSYWITQIQMNKLLFNVRLPYSPVEVFNVSVIYGEDHLFTDYTAKEKNVYITFDPTGENKSYIGISSTNIAFSLARVYGLNVTGACLVNSSVCAEMNAPIITCSDKVDGIVVVIEETGPAGVEYRDNCLIISGQGAELSRASTRAVLEWYNIIKINETTQKVIEQEVVNYK